MACLSGQAIPAAIPKSLLGNYNLSKKQAFLAATLLDFSP
jgi:hypothetical protein